MGMGPVALALTLTWAPGILHMYMKSPLGDSGGGSPPHGGLWGPGAPEDTVGGLGAAAPRNFMYMCFTCKLLELKINNRKLKMVSISCPI